MGVGPGRKCLNEPRDLPQYILCALMLQSGVGKCQTEDLVIVDNIINDVVSVRRLVSAYISELDPRACLNLR